MKRMQSRKSHSWWWDSHISPKNSKWLAENLENMDRLVKEMLKLIEEEGDSFAKKAEMYYQRRPELVSHVEDFYRMYRALAERYDHVTGELRNTIPSELHSHGSGSGTDLSSGPPSPSLSQSPESTPDCKPASRLSGRAAGFDFVLGSSGSTDLTKKGSDVSSSSESDSESDYSKESVEDLSSGLHQRITELEKELTDMREKLGEYEKDSNGQCEHLDNGDSTDLSCKVAALEEELMAANEKIFAMEVEIVSLQKKLEEDNISLQSAHIELGLERKNVSKLELRITGFEAVILDYKQEIENLTAVVASTTKQYETDLLKRDQAIDEYKKELASVSKRYLQEKSILESDSANLQCAIQDLKAKVNAISEEKSQLEARFMEQEHLIQELKAVVANSAKRFVHENSMLEIQVRDLSHSYVILEAKLRASEDEIRLLEDKKAELNRNLKALNLKCDMLASEKEELSDKVIVITDDIKNQNDRFCQMAGHLHQLHNEHAKLIAEAEEAKKAGIKLRERVKELEDEVDGQRIMILDGAEGKREAIRQLCFSLEHYRDGYHQLRQVLLGHKHPMVMAR